MVVGDTDMQPVNDPHHGVVGWDIAPGTVTTRSDIAAAYGGATQGGIQPSRTTDNVLLFSDPQAGALHGYNFDGFASDGAYYYTGEGQVGDQEIVRGNAAIVNHREQNRALQLFEAAGGRQPGGKPQRFIGTFELDPAEPYRYETAKDASGVPRRVVVFRLIPTTAVAATADPRIKTLDLPAHAQLVAPENNQSATFPVQPSSQPRQATRWEATVMAQLETHLAHQNHEVRRVRINLPGESTSLVTDTYDATTNELFEVKPTASRKHIREAVSQLLDYSRHIPDLQHCTIAVPVTPSQDLQHYIHSAGVGLAVVTNDRLDRVPFEPRDADAAADLSLTGLVQQHALSFAAGQRSASPVTQPAKQHNVTHAPTIQR